MSGVAIIRNLLVSSANVTAVIPASRIVAGDIPPNSTMPAISIRLVSGATRWTVKMPGSHVMHTDRVQVSYLFKDASAGGTGYPGLRAMAPLVLTAGGNRRGTVAGFSLDSVLPDIEGPDLYDAETMIHQGSRDFIVKWTD